MERPTKRGPGRPEGSAYPEAFKVYENAKGMELVRALAERRGCGLSALVRALVREEAQRQGLTDSQQ